MQKLLKSGVLIIGNSKVKAFKSTWIGIVLTWVTLQDV